MPQIIPKLQNFFVNYSEKKRKKFPGGFMGEFIGKGLPNILLFILYRKG